MFTTSTSLDRPVSASSSTDRFTPAISLSVRSLADEAHLFAVRLFSTAFLGHGYIPKTEGRPGQLLETSLQSLSRRLEDVVSITSDESVRIVVANHTCQGAITALKQAFNSNDKIGPAVTNAVFPDHGDIDTQQLDHFNLNKKKIVCAAVCIRAIKCTLSSISSLERVKSVGTHTVMGGWVYFAYKVFCIISTSSTNVDKVNQPHAPQEDLSQGLGKRKSSLMEELKGRNYISIESRVECFGDFRFRRRFPMPKNFNELTKTINALHQDYLSQANTITMRHFCVDEQSLRSNALFFSSHSFPMSFTDRLTATSTHTQRVDFTYLASQIQQKKHANYNQFNDNHFTVEIFLSSLEKVFSNVFKRGKLLKNPAMSYTAVLGPPKLGSSLFIGYMLGAGLVMRSCGDALQGTDGSWYFDYQSGGDAYPQLGHSNSQTKGFGVFQKYLETSGLLGFEDAEEGICNSWAVKLGFDTFRPDRIIIMISPDDFFYTAGSGVINIIEKLKRSIRNFSDPKILRSILIVVKEHLINPKDLLRYKKDHILLLVKKLIQIQTKERDQHLGTDSEFRKRASTQMPLSESEIQNFITKLERENSDLGKIVANHQENITILKSILSLDNIVIADLRNDRTRQEIDRWEYLEKIAAEQRRHQGHAGLCDSLQMQHLVHHGTEKTHEILTAFVDYFNHLFKECARLKTLETKFQDYFSLFTIEKELTTYHRYCNLVAQVLNQLQFCESSHCTHWECYSEFRNNVESYFRNASFELSV